MAIACDPQSLATAANQFACCIPGGYHIPIQTYLLASISNALAGTSMDPQTLANAARCFECSASDLAAMDVYLLCQIAQASGA